MIDNVKFPKDLVLRRMREAIDGVEFLTEHMYSVTFDVDGEPRKYTVSKGFPTDLASVPWGFRNIASQLDGIEAAVVHDHIYATGSMPRDVADNLFLALLKASGVGWAKRSAMYSAVRVGGWMAYKG